MPVVFREPYFWQIPRRGTTAVRWSGLLVSPAAPVIPLPEAKLHARLDADQTVEDSLVASWILAAQQQVQTETGHALGPQTWDFAGDRPPNPGDPIVLPLGPLQSVTHIKSYDSATPSVLQTMDMADYVVDVVSIPGRIGLADAASWPTDLRGFQPITLRVVVGYASVGVIPEPLLQGVREAIAWCAANREPTAMELDSYNWWIDSYRPVVVA